MLFLLVDNEAYDYLGSNKVMVDIRRGDLAKMTGVPIELRHIGLLLEFGELGFADYKEAVFHYPRLDNDVRLYRDGVFVYGGGG